MLIFNIETASVDQRWSKVCDSRAGRWTGNLRELLLPSWDSTVLTMTVSVDDSILTWWRWHQCDL